MAKYGYRIFAVELHDGGKHEAQPFGEAKRPAMKDGVPTGVVHQFDYRDVLISDVAAQQMKLHPFGTMDAAEDDETGPVQAKGMAIRFAKAVKANDTVRLWFEQGVTNADGTLIVNGEDVEMKNKPTLHPYRACLLAETKGTIALLAVEVRGRACPSGAVIRGLKACSDVPWRLQVLGNLAGEAAMMAFIEEAAAKRVVFDRWTFDDDGQRDVNDVSMSVSTDGVDVKSWVRQWAESFFETFSAVRRRQKITVAEVDHEGNRLSRAEITAARKLARQEQKAAVAAARVERRESAAARTREATAQLREDIFVSRGENVEIDFNAVGVDLDDGTRRQRITPTTDFSKFTYVLGRGYIPDDRFYHEAEATMRNLLPQIRALPLSDSPSAAAS